LNCFSSSATASNRAGLNDTDKRHAIVLALQTWPERSGRQIAEQVGCALSYLQRIKDEVTPSGHLPSHVTGKDGKRYPATRKTTPPALDIRQSAGVVYSKSGSARGSARTATCASRRGSNARRRQLGRQCR